MRPPAWLLALLLLVAAAAPTSFLVAAARTPAPAAEADPALREAWEAARAGLPGRASDRYGRAAGLGADSAGLWLGWGNALYRLGDLPRARRAWENARLRAPRDGHVSAALDRVLPRLKLDEPPPNPLVRLAEWFTPAELVAGWSLLSFLGLALAAWCQPTHARSTAARSVSGRLRGAVALLVLALPFGLLLAIRGLDQAGGPAAVVVVPDLRLRAGPGREFPEAAAVAAGSLVRVQEQSGYWRRIRTGAGFGGWLRAEHLEPVSPGPVRNGSSPGAGEGASRSGGAEGGQG